MEEVKKQGMESLFCPYEQALELKELGFDSKGYFGVWMMSNSYPELIIKGELLSNDIIAPLWQQAFDWFAKNNLFISITRYRKSSIKNNPTIFTDLYDADIIDENNDLNVIVGEFNTYEKAREACLIELIKLCKKS